MTKKKQKWSEFQVHLSTGDIIHIVHNMKLAGSVNSIIAAYDNWLARTEVYTSESLCEYINSKGSEYFAITKKEFDTL